MRGEDAPDLRLARAIAARIARWIAAGEILESQDRPIRAGDVMVLVGRRTGFVDALVRAADDHGGRFLAVLAVRADFYGAVAGHARLARRTGEDQMLVGPPRPGALARGVHTTAALSAQAPMERVWDAQADPSPSASTSPTARPRGKRGARPLIATSPGVGYRIMPAAG